MLAAAANGYSQSDQAATEAPVISTERPTVGDSPDLTPAHTFQVESGLGLTLQRHKAVADMPEMLLRYAVSSVVEVRLQASNEEFQSSAPPGTHAFQTADMALSAKFLIAGPDRFLPKSGVLTLSLPTGGKSWSSGSVDPSLAAIWTQALPHAFFLNQVAQATLTTLASARRPLWAPSIAGGRTLSRATTVFGEYAPALLPDRTLEQIVDGGIAVTRGKLLQLDFRAGCLRDEAGTHTLLTIGYSRRYDSVLPGLTPSNLKLWR